MTSSAAKRRRSAYAAAAAAKQRRQKIIVIVGFALFLALMAYEVPHILGRKSGTAAPAAAPVAIATQHPRVLPKAFRRGAGVDPFAVQVSASSDPKVGPALPGHDPFASPAVQAAAETPASPLPETIVIGKPTASGATVHGWIVILASIPTARGQASAESFARAARRDRIGAVAVLNSSNRRPLRGGYWVVYTGPVRTVSDAERLASDVHSSGYGTAYVRELIEYKAAT
jgi:hypothetical protein